MATTDKALAAQILKYLREHPKSTAKDIAGALNVDKRDVNSLLYGELTAQVRQGSSYEWMLRNGPRTDREEASKVVDTPLSRLCNYYLGCLSYDFVDELSCFAQSKFDPEYVVLSSVFPDYPSLVGDAAARKLIDKVRSDRNRIVLYVGYLCLVRSHTGKRGWKGNFIEPLLVMPLTGVGDRAGEPRIEVESLRLNPRALKSLTRGSDAVVLQEALELAEELGLTDQPDLFELALRLRALRPDWPWLQPIDPEAVEVESFNDRTVAGIYNRAVLMLGERSPYTAGLESELAQLGKLKVDDYAQTALGQWLRGETASSYSDAAPAIIEPVQLNTEQREAVRRALRSPLTVITGPPGTGKSQVVTAIVANAAWSGQKVVVASKNNKAVDVVEQRTNALGPRPILVRLGSGDRQAALSQLVNSYLSARPDRDGGQRPQNANARFGEVRIESARIEQELARVVELRNRVDALERAVEEVRKTYGGELFGLWRQREPTSVEEAIESIVRSANRAFRVTAPWFERLVWPILRRRRIEALRAMVDANVSTFSLLGLSLPHEVAEPLVPSVLECCTEAMQRLERWTAVRGYSDALTELQSAPRVEELARASTECDERVAATSGELWVEWLQIQPAKLNVRQRQKLGELHAALELSIHSADDESSRVVMKRLQTELATATDVFSCWAITSLAARGRLPFRAAMFDLVIIDEASQCDIASALPLLFRAKRAVVIGDPKQLKHISALPEAEDRRLLIEHDLIDTRLGWAYSVRSLFDLASSLVGTENIVDLADHHRSHHQIIEFSNEHFYERRLRVATRHEALRPPAPDSPAVRWVRCTGEVRRPQAGGAVNAAEAEMVVDELRSLLLGRGYAGSVGIVTPFRAQANLIRDKVYADVRLLERGVDADLLIDTVHKFQGDERDVMFFSPTVSTGTPDGAISFLKKSGNLFNVAVTRARACLIVIGDRVSALSSGVDYLSSFAQYTIALENEALPHAEPGQDFGPVYPTVARPDLVSEWERLFYAQLYRLGIRAVPQYNVDRYLLDFAIIDGDRRLDIEIDGEAYHRDWDGELMRRDKIRNQRLFELGWDVMRFWVYEVRDDLPRCLNRIRTWLDARGNVQSSGLQQPALVRSVSETWSAE